MVDHSGKVLLLFNKRGKNPQRAAIAGNQGPGAGTEGQAACPSSCLSCLCSLPARPPGAEAHIPLLSLGTLS